MDHAEDDDLNVGAIFIYRGGRAPQHITHALIDESVYEIEENAFRDCENLVQVETHNGIRRIGKRAFLRCHRLRQINLRSVVEIDENAFFCCEKVQVETDGSIRSVGDYAFCVCTSLRHIDLKSAIDIGIFAFDACRKLECVEFGDYLETIGKNAFGGCDSLRHLKLPSIITLGDSAFSRCKRLIDIELPMGLETMEERALWDCERLQRIATPLKRDLFELDRDWQRYCQFEFCKKLVTVDLVGGIHKTVASLHMDSWRNEMIAEINRINQVLPTKYQHQKTEEIRQWMEVVIDKRDRYKAEHHRYVKEGITLLELALWKVKLGKKEDSSVEGPTKKAKVDSESVRKERRVTCGADIVIKNVLPFLQLLE